YLVNNSGPRYAEGRSNPPIDGGCKDMKPDLETNGAARNADRVHAEIRKKILSMELSPGSVFDEARIVHEAGVSRTPVREAVIRLISEGFLIRDGRQVRVASFDISQFQSVFESMVLLSRTMHRLAALRRERHHLKSIWQALRRFEDAAKAANEAQ